MASMIDCLQVLYSRNSHQPCEIVACVVKEVCMFMLTCGFPFRITLCMLKLQNPVCLTF